MATLTIADLDNGKRDLETVDAVANSSADTTTTRYGDSVLTLAGALRRLGYQAPVPYASGLNVDSPLFTVEYGSPAVVYRPALVPFTTGAWNPTQWRVVQNTGGTNLAYQFPTLNEAEIAAATLPGGSAITVEGVSQGHVVSRAYVPDSGVPAVTLGTYADLLAYSGRAQVIDLVGVMGLSRPDRKAGRFVKTDRAGATTDDGIVFVTPAGTFERDIGGGAVRPEWYGAVPFDSTLAVAQANYTAIRKALAYCLTHDPVRLEAQNQLHFGTGEFFIAGNSPFCFTRTEMMNLPGAYRYRRGMKFSGEGKYSTIITQIMPTDGEKWFYDTQDANYPNDSSVMDYLTFEGMTLRGVGVTHRLAPNNKTSCFRFITHGWEKFITFRDFAAEHVDSVHWIAGYGNADHLRWFGCHWKFIRDRVFYVNNNQSVANKIFGCDAEEIFGSVFEIGPEGGGDFTWYGGSVILYPELDTKGSPLPVQNHRAFVAWNNSGKTTGPSSGPGNNQFIFNSLRFETYDSKQSFVFSYRAEAEPYGALEVVFNDCSMVNAHQYGTWGTPAEMYRGVILENNVTVRFNRCQLGRHYSYAVEENEGHVFFEDCNYVSGVPNDELADKCTVNGFGGLIQCRGLTSNRLKTQGVYSSVIGADFTKSVGANVTKPAFIQAKHYNTQWPQLTKSPNVNIFLPPGSVVSKLSIVKPGGSLPSPVSDYTLRIVGASSEILLDSGAGNENRPIRSSVSLTTPYVVPAAPNNLIIVAAGGSASASLFSDKSGSIYVEYL